MISGSNIYGTTDYGGAYNDGTVFSVPLSGGTPTILTSFNGTNGSGPTGGLTLSGSTLYGSTVGGGASSDGTVFSLPLRGGTATVLTSFNNANGQWPKGALTISGTNIYGITNRGGSYLDYSPIYGCGTVFSLPVGGGTANTLFSFVDTNGENPSGGLTLSGSTFYGSATVGGAGSGYGTVYSFPASGGSCTVLTSFSQVSIGANPIGTVVVSGSLIYGITQGGGPNSTGEVFSLPINGGTPTALLAFPSNGGSLGGTYGVQGNLILSGSTLYGTAVLGGAYGEGLVFEVNTDGSHYNDLFDFSGSNGGWAEGLTLSGSNLYGTTQTGGSNGGGTVFSLNVLAGTVRLTNPVAATIIAGGTATLGATIANSANHGLQ